MFIRLKIRLLKRAYTSSLRRYQKNPIPNAPLPDKYKKMITMGIPTAAVNHQKQLDLKACINSDMLSSVQLKPKYIIKSMNGFEPQIR